MIKKIALFDIDGTLAESGQKVAQEMKEALTLLNRTYDIGIVGGGRYEKIYEQLDGYKVSDIFSENGCVYHTWNQMRIMEVIHMDQNPTKVYVKDIRNHPLYGEMNKLIKKSLEFLSKVDYTITGHFVDLRNGIIYISLIGMVATQEERKYFLELDKQHNYRIRLLELLKEQAVSMGIINLIDIVEGGSVGIAIFPSEWDKIQVLDNFKDYDTIVYFGDKHSEHGNDYKLLTHDRVKGYPVNSIEDTLMGIRSLIV
jgi:HAD superfamily hydrolase (TIGR01484 family)